MQTVNADRKRPKATAVAEDAEIAENNEAREDARPPTVGNLPIADCGLREC
jgi:hypothetical protein